MELFQMPSAGIMQKSNTLIRINDFTIEKNYIKNSYRLIKR